MKKNIRIKCMCSGQVLRSYQKEQFREFGSMKSKWKTIGWFCNKCKSFYSNEFVNYLLNFENKNDYTTITVFSFVFSKWNNKKIELKKLSSKLLEKIRKYRKKLHEKGKLEYKDISFYENPLSVKTLNNFR